MFSFPLPSRMLLGACLLLALFTGACSNAPHTPAGPATAGAAVPLPKGVRVTVQTNSKEPPEAPVDSQKLAACVVEGLRCQGPVTLAQLAQAANSPCVFTVHATWCSYCKPLLRDYPALRKRYSRLTFYTLSIDRSAELPTLKKELARFNVLTGNFILAGTPDNLTDPLNREAGSRFLKCLGTDWNDSGFPYLFITDKAGRILFQSAGYDDSLKAVYAAQFSRL